MLVSVGQKKRQRINYFYVNEAISLVSTEHLLLFQSGNGIFYSVLCIVHILLFLPTWNWGPPKCWGPLAVAQSAPLLIRHCFVTSSSRMLCIVSTDFLALRLFSFNIRQHGCQILYFKLHVDGRKLHYRRPQVLHPCATYP